MEKSTTETKRASAKQRQAAAQKLGATRIQSGKQRQAAAKKAARARGAKTS